MEERTKQQVEGSEPVVKINDAGDAELAWGVWTVTAWIESRAYAGGLGYTMHVDFNSGGEDGDGRGLCGELTTPIEATPADAGTRAARSMRFHVHSLHQEPNEDDWCEHERTLDLGPLLTLAVMEYATATAARSGL